MPSIEISLDQIEQATINALVAHGASEWIANCVAKAVRVAEQNGNVICGLYYLDSYCTQLKTGRVNGRVDPVVSKPREGIVSVDAKFGFAQAAAGNSTVVGNTSADCSPSVGSTLDGGGYSGLDEFTYNSSTSSFDLVGSSGTATGTSADVFLSSSAPGFYTLVIPRVNNNSDSCEIEVVGYCGTAWDLDVNCPAALPSIPINLDSDDCTTTAFPTFFYVAPNRGNTPGEPSVNEFAFKDPSGLDQSDAGTYVMNPPSGKAIVEIDTNGVIINITSCP